MIFEVCVALITVAFIVLVVYLVITLISLRKTLVRADDILSKIDAKVEPLSAETVKLLQNSNALTGRVKDQLASFDPLLDSISDVGKALQGVTNSFSEKPSYRFRFLKESAKAKSHWQDNVSEILELAALGINVWQNIQKRR